MTIYTDKQLLQLAPYNFYRNNLPPFIDKVSSHYIDHLQRFFKEKPPKTISTVILTRYLRHQVGYGEQFSVNFFAFGTFRKHFSAIETLSNVLAPIFSEMHVLPLITPILDQEWKEQEMTIGRVYTEIREYGIIIYSKLSEA